MFFFCFRVKKYYELLSEMNGGPSDRIVGIDMCFYPEKFPGKKIIFPSLSEDGDYYGGVDPENCEFQGYFYDDEYNY